MYLKILATALSAPVAFAALASDTGLSFTPEKISTEIDFWHFKWQGQRTGLSA